MKLLVPTSDKALGSGDMGSLSDPVGLVRGSAAEHAEMRQATCKALWKLSASNLAQAMGRTMDGVKVYDVQQIFQDPGFATFFADLVEILVD